MNTKKWIRHFENNRLHRPEPNWQAPLKLSDKALQPLITSLQQFQLGDGGGPAYLIAWNQNGLLACDAGVKKLVDLWFKEEEEHSRLLGAALKRFQAAEITTHWSFELFCGLRKYLGVRFELGALLLTEIVSNVYYKMLSMHVEDEALKSMCRLIIRDETGHIAFHRARLAEDQKKHTYGKWWEATFRLGGLAAGTVLWINHRAALKTFGATDAEFYRAIWKDMSLFVKRLRKDCRKAVLQKPQKLGSVSLRVHQLTEVKAGHPV